MTFGIRSSGPVVAPPSAQSPVQAPQQHPTPRPGPDTPPWSPLPPGTPPTDGPGTPPQPPTLPPDGSEPPTDGPGSPPWTPGTPPQPPTVPPDGPHTPEVPTKPPAPGPGPGPTPPPLPPPGPGPGPDPIDDGPNVKPWLVGAAVVGAGAAGIAGVLALRSGSRNVEALRSLATSYNTGALNQGGLHAIRDAELGARFAGGIGASEYLMVALPGVNRVGTGGRLTAVARGHLDTAELLASSAALRHAGNGSVVVDEPLRAVVRDGLTSGRSMRGVLDDLDRSAANARPVFDNPQLTRYWDQASIVERGPRAGADHVTSAVRLQVPTLQLDRSGEIVETGASMRINQIVAGRGADLDGRGLASGIGGVQSANVSTLPPALQRRALAESGVTPERVEALGLHGAFSERWRERLA